VSDNIPGHTLIGHTISSTYRQRSLSCVCHCYDWCAYRIFDVGIVLSQGTLGRYTESIIPSYLGSDFKTLPITSGIFTVEQDLSAANCSRDLIPSIGVTPRVLMHVAPLQRRSSVRAGTLGHTECPAVVSYRSCGVMYMPNVCRMRYRTSSAAITTSTATANPNRVAKR
jgi:hypothetical protein